MVSEAIAIQECNYEIVINLGSNIIPKKSIE